MDKNKPSDNDLAAIVDEISEDIILELVFEFDEELRTSLDPKEIYKADEIEPVIDTRPLRYRSTKDFLGNEVVNVKYPDVSCPNCDRNVIVTKLSWHMSRCMFPNSGRAAALRARKDEQNEENSEEDSNVKPKRIKNTNRVKKPKKKIPNELLVAGTTTRAQKRNGRRGDFLLDDDNSSNSVCEVKVKVVEPLKIRIPKEALEKTNTSTSPKQKSLSPRVLLRKSHNLYSSSYLRHSYLKSHLVKRKRQSHKESLSLSSEENLDESEMIADEETD